MKKANKYPIEIQQRILSYATSKSLRTFKQASKGSYELYKSLIDLPRDHQAALRLCDQVTHLNFKLLASQSFQNNIITITAEYKKLSKTDQYSGIQALRKNIIAELAQYEHLNFLLLSALENNQYQLALACIAAGADVHYESNGKCPLYVASRHPNSFMLRQLLENGANPNSSDFVGRSLLAETSAENMCILLSYGANPRAKVDIIEAYQKTISWFEPQHVTPFNGHFPEMVKKLIEERLKAIEAWKANRSENRALEITRQLVNCLLLNTSDLSLMLRFADEKMIELVSLCIAAGMPIGYKGRGSCNALLSATKNKDHDMMRLLLHLGADPNITAAFNTTLLMISAEQQDLDGVKLLLQANADTELKDWKDKTVWDYAADNPEILALLKHHASGMKEPMRPPSKIWELSSLASDSQAWLEKIEDDIFTILSDLEPLVRPYRTSTLLRACQQNYFDLAMLCIMANIDVCHADNLGRTPLSYAAQHGNIELAKTLLEHGASANKRCKEQKSPIIYAYQHKHKACTELLQAFNYQHDVIDKLCKLK